MHPLQMIHGMFHIIRNNFVIVIFFLINWNNPSFFFKYGKWLLFSLLFLQLIHLIIKWFFLTYELKDYTVHIYSGIFKKKHRSMPLERVQNVQRHTPFHFKIFDVTSITFETGLSDDNASIEFEAVSLKEADKIEKYLTDYQNEIQESGESLEQEAKIEMEEDGEPIAERTIHFHPTNKEVFKASFLSFSFLAFIPVVLTAYFKLEEIIDIEKQAEGILSFIFRSWMTVALFIFIFICFAFLFGLTHTYLKYGKYEIASDQDYIYIRRGVLNEKSFSIQKSRVQAVQINQPFLKKLLGLVEVELISASTGFDVSEEVSSLYPFLPAKKANHILAELLPHFQITETMKKLPRRALYVKMLRIPILFLIALLLILWRKPDWWYVLPVILIVTYMMRFFQYRNTRYVTNGPYIQFKVGGLSSTLFVTTREKITEARLTCSYLQKQFGLCSISTDIRTSHAHVEELADLSIEAAEQFFNWYGNRLSEVKYEKL